MFSELKRNELKEILNRSGVDTNGENSKKGLVSIIMKGENRIRMTQSEIERIGMDGEERRKTRHNLKFVVINKRGRPDNSQNSNKRRRTSNSQNSPSTLDSESEVKKDMQQFIYKKYPFDDDDKDEDYLEIHRRVRENGVDVDDLAQYLSETSKRVSRLQKVVCRLYGEGLINDEDLMRFLNEERTNRLKRSLKKAVSDDIKRRFRNFLSEELSCVPQNISARFGSGLLNETRLNSMINEYLGLNDDPEIGGNNDGDDIEDLFDDDIEDLFDDDEERRRRRRRRKTSLQSSIEREVKKNEEIDDIQVIPPPPQPPPPPPPPRPSSSTKTTPRTRTSSSIVRQPPSPFNSSVPRKTHLPRKKRVTKKKKKKLVTPTRNLNKKATTTTTTRSRKKSKAVKKQIEDDEQYAKSLDCANTVASQVFWGIVSPPPNLVSTRRRTTTNTIHGQEEEEVPIESVTLPSRKSEKTRRLSPIRVPVNLNSLRKKKKTKKKKGSQASRRIRTPARGRSFSSTTSPTIVIPSTTTTSHQTTSSGKKKTKTTFLTIDE